MQTVFDQIKLVDDWHCPDQSVITVTDIEAGTKVVNRRRTASNARSSFQQKGVYAGPSEVCSADKSVVATTDNNHIGFHQRWVSNHQLVRWTLTAIPIPEWSRLGLRGSFGIC